jgi:flagellar hook-basal body complex protein FliE
MGRSRLSNIELLPEECAEVVAWAAAELQNRDRTQTDIYSEFVAKLEAVQREHRGEIEFTIPSFTAFNRYSVKLTVMTQRINQTREIASTLAGKFDAGASDDLTLIAAEAIKTLIFELLTSGGEAGIDPKGAMALANALRSATQAQGISSARRLKVEQELAAKASQAIQAVAKAKGLSGEATQEIMDQFLGIKT